MAPKILIADDEPGMRKSLAIMLRREGYAVSEAASGQDALDQLGAEVFGLVISDLRMTPVSGLDLLRAVKQANSAVEVILMTGFGSIESAVEAMKLGAFDFITKPFQQEEIVLRVRNALEKHRLKAEVDLLRAEVTSAFGVDGIVGASEPIRHLLELIPRVARTDSTVLITGESGTGKELVARAVHAASRRSQGPFISVSCAALPETLLESELFGHIKGAFTGAQAARKGLLEEAHQGTFFLDEIGEAPAPIQAKLLRVLEERTIRRLGDNRSIAIDVRIITATNRDLDAAVRDKQFREDLLYRLNVIRIHLPPLRERMEDLPLLIRHFLAVHGRKLERRLEGVAPAALEALRRYSFPGNVRELSHMIERAVALAAGPLIEAPDLPEVVRRGETPSLPAAGAPAPTTSPLKEAVDTLEHEQILEALRQADWNISRAAQRLGISRNTLRYRMEKFHLKP
jgi:two-component system response regulator HydG